MKDRREGQFCWQELEALDAIRERWSGRELVTAIAIYTGMTSLAAKRYRQGGRDGFVADRAEIARESGTKPASVDKFAKGLIDLGLVGRERRTDERGADLPSEWFLKSPTRVPVEAHGGAPTAAVGAPPKRARANTAVEGRGNGSVSAAKAAETEPVGLPANAGKPTFRIEGNDGTTPTALKDQRSASERDADPEFVRLADLLAELVAANRDGRPVKPSDVVRWRRPIRLMVERDNLTAGVEAKRAKRDEPPFTTVERRAKAVEIVEKAIRWCQADSFWSKNVLSGSKLRERYDQLEAAARAERGQGPAQPGGPVVDRSDERLQEAAA